MHTQRPAAQIFSAVRRVSFRAAAFFLEGFAAGTASRIEGSET